MRHLRSIDVGMRAGRALHLLDELTRLEIVDLARFEMIVGPSREASVIDRACESLNPESADRAPPDKGGVDRKAGVLQNQADSGRIKDTHRQFMYRSRRENWSFHARPVHHGVEVAAAPGRWNRVGMCPMRDGALHQGERIDGPGKGSVSAGPLQMDDIDDAAEAVSHHVDA